MVLTEQMRTVTWTEMADGTEEDYHYLDKLFTEHTRGALVDNLLGILATLQGPKLGYQVDRYEHSLQSASRALRADESADWVVAALLHDIGDVFAPENHSEAAAAILAPYVSDEVAWVVKHHGIFQGYYYFHHLGGNRDARDRYADSPHYEACRRFCADYDQNCFDPDYDTLPVEAFSAALDEVFARPSRLPTIG